MAEQRLTQVTEVDSPTEGYIVIAPFSNASKQSIADIQNKFVERFGEKNLWIPSGDQLHVTFSHIITPEVAYPEDKGALFSRLRPLASAALRKAIRWPLSVKLTFDTISTFPEAVILKATDDGSFERLRSNFIQNFTPPDGTRMPPNIIHTTILRFRNTLDLIEVQNLTREIMSDFQPFEETTTNLRMIREKKVFVQEYEILEVFPSS